MPKKNSKNTKPKYTNIYWGPEEALYPELLKIYFNQNGIPVSKITDAIKLAVHQYIDEKGIKVTSN